MEKNSIATLLFCVVLVTGILMIPISGISAEKNNLKEGQWCCSVEEEEDDSHHLVILNSLQKYHFSI
jgi:hypothetical protein